MNFHIIIEPGRTGKNYWKDLWRHRELFYILSWRDIKVRYKQTGLGIGWAIIRPLLTLLVFTYVFGHLASMPVITTAPYAILVFAGLLPWQFFASALSESSNSLISNERLITKVYFPRLIIPASSMITSFIDFLISFMILTGLFFYYHYTPPVQVWLIPVGWILLFVVSFGPGLFFTSLNTKYRDVRHLIPFIIQFGLFISPVGFSSQVIPKEWQWAWALNPMTGVIDFFRWCIIRDAPNPLLHYPFYISLAVSVFFIFLSLYQFRKMEKQFADYI